MVYASRPSGRTAANSAQNAAKAPQARPTRPEAGPTRPHLLPKLSKVTAGHTFARMESTIRQVSLRVGHALGAAFGQDGAGTDPLVRPAQSPDFGDYQSNCAMTLAKRVAALGPRADAAA